MHDAKTPVVARLIAERHRKPIRRLLVVGCGSGLEAVILQRELHCEVIGVDTKPGFDAQCAREVRLEIGDALNLRFEDGGFDFVYSYHALEHMSDHRRALAEMSRVLEPGGGFCVGTPNRSRLVGYIGSKDATFREKLFWNWVDWRARFAGRFRNELGAHAGYSRAELQAALDEAFGHVADITLPYYLGLYGRQGALLKALHATGVSALLFPSIFFVGEQQRAQAPRR